MDSDLIQWVKQPVSGTRSRYAGDRGICLEHDAPRQNCTPCSAKKVRRSDDIKMRAENLLYRFELQVTEPMLMLALCLNRKDFGFTHHAYFMNGSGSMSRSGLVTGVIKSSTEKTILEHENHEVLVVKQNGVRNAFKYRRDILESLEQELQEQAQSNPLIGKCFEILRDLPWPDDRLVPSQDLSLCFFFVPLAGDYKDVIVKISEPVSYMRRPPAPAVSGSKRSRHNSMASSQASDYNEPLANWRFPTVPRDLADLVREARASFTVSRPIPRFPALAETIQMRSRLRQHITDRVATRNPIGEPVVTGSEPTCNAQNCIILEEMDVEMVDDQDLSGFDADAEASALFTPAQPISSCNVLINANYKSEDTLNQLMMVQEISDSDIEEMRKVASTMEPAEILRLLEPDQPLETIIKPECKQPSFLEALQSSDDENDFEDFGFSFTAPQEHAEDSCSLGDIEPFVPLP